MAKLTQEQADILAGFSFGLLIAVIIGIFTYAFSGKDDIYQVVCRNSAVLTFAGDFQEAYFEGEHIQTNRGAYFPGDFEQCEIVRRDGNGSR